MINAIIKKNVYYDSVALMRITSRITQIPGIREASVCMGTDLNKELLVDSGLAGPETQTSTPNDLIIAFDAEDAIAPADIVRQVEEMLVKKAIHSSTEEAAPVSLGSALSVLPEANLAVISVPGRFAYGEAKKALMAGLNVFLFSDNLSIEEEKDLKTYASRQGLLVMGPDCGTAIINQTALCFANEVRSGSIGLVAASGTGLQEITVLIDRFGGGITQAIGVGGRDLSQEIGGIMMLDALEALKADPATEVIVLLSKKPAQAIADRIIASAADSGKPTVICFLGSPPAQPTGNLWFETTLEDAARKALDLANIPTGFITDDLTLVLEAAEQLQPEQTFVRGLFCGGTLCSEAHHIFKQSLGGVAAFSNTSKDPAEALVDLAHSRSHTFLDLGDDHFTVGKPHPMIDPSIRNARIIQEAMDPETAVLLLDFEIGHGSHEDPAGIALKALTEARRISPDLVMIAYVLGTERDHQGLRQQQDKLRNAGVILADSNAQAARMAAAVIRRYDHE